MSNTVTIYLAGGGTGGHLYPGIAVAEAIRKSLPGSQVMFLCTTRDIDAVILEKTGFQFLRQPIVPPVRTIAGLLRFWRSWRETKEMVGKLIKECPPAAVLGLGGYAAGVAVKVGASRGIATAILNPDVIPGKANYYLMRYVKAVCCQFEATAGYVSPRHRGKLQVTGCPIREQIVQLPSREEATGRLGLDSLLRTVTVTGASQGAQTVNEAVLESLKAMKLNGWQVLHLAGRDHADSVRAGYRELSLGARVIDFTAAMADVWAVTDLAISRAGASSCAELTACGIASILMPYPFHKDMHQRANAKVLEDAGAAIMVDDQKDRRNNAARLRPAIESLLYDADKRKAMAQAARNLAKPQAAQKIVSVITGMLESGR